MSNEKISEILNEYVQDVSGIAKFLLLNENIHIEVNRWGELHSTLTELHRAGFLVYQEDRDSKMKIEVSQFTARVTLSDELRAYFRAMLL